jgi:hypothetical protein
MDGVDEVDEVDEMDEMDKKLDSGSPPTRGQASRE